MRWKHSSNQAALRWGRGMRSVGRSHRALQVSREQRVLSSRLLEQEAGRGHWVWDWSGRTGCCSAGVREEGLALA